jgi:hypothetical protein
MRRRIKRRLFLMSMALAAGASGQSHAQGGKNMAGQGHHFGGDDADAALLLPDVGGSGTGGSSSGFVDRIKRTIAGLGEGAEARTATSAARGWRLEMFQPEPRPEMGGDPRLEKAKHFGMAFRMTF